jgi:hypothetical protein
VIGDIEREILAHHSEADESNVRVGFCHKGTVLLRLQLRKNHSDFFEAS